MCVQMCFFILPSLCVGSEAGGRRYEKWGRRRGVKHMVGLGERKEEGVG